MEVSAPLLNPEASGFQGTPPLSRSTSRSSSASVTPPPHTPFPAIQNVPVCEVGDVEQVSIDLKKLQLDIDLNVNISLYSNRRTVCP